MRKGNGFADRVHNRITKGRISIFDSEAPNCPHSSLAGRWITYCEWHCFVWGFASCYMAHLQSKTPEAWCVGCASMVDEIEADALKNWKLGIITSEEFKKILGMEK